MGVTDVGVVVVPQVAVVHLAHQAAANFKKRKSLDLKGKRHTNSPNTASFYLSDKGLGRRRNHTVWGGKLHSSFPPTIKVTFLYLSKTLV